MPNIKVTDRRGRSSTEAFEVGGSLMKALKSRGYDVQAVCGGIRSCATCHVMVDPSWAHRLPEQSEDELEILQESDHYQAGLSRLSCQIPVTVDLEGLAVTLAPED